MSVPTQVLCVLIKHCLLFVESNDFVVQLDEEVEAMHNELLSLKQQLKERDKEVERYRQQDTTDAMQQEPEIKEEQQSQQEQGEDEQQDEAAV
jgi:hypothetical protein